MSAFRSTITMRPQNRAEKKFIYLLVGIIAVVATAFAVVFLFPKGSTASGVKLDQTFTQGDNQFTFAGASRYANKTTYQLNLSVKNNQIDPLQPITANACTRSAGNGEKLPAKMVQVSEDFYALVVKKVPDNQTSLYVAIGTNKQLNGGLSMSSSQPISIQKAAHSDQSSIPSSRVLEREYFTYMIHFYGKRITTYRQKVKDTDANIATLKATLKKQKASLSVQTGSQKAATKQKISDTESSLKTQQTERASAQKSAKSARIAREKYQNQLK